MNKLYRFLPILVASVFVLSGAEKKGSFDITDNAPVKIDVAGDHSFLAGGTSKGGDVPVTPGLQNNGSFELTVAGGKDPELPSVPALAKRSVSVQAGGTTKGGDVPVITGKRASFHVAAGGTSKGGDVPVVTGKRVSFHVAGGSAGGSGKVVLQ